MEMENEDLMPLRKQVRKGRITACAARRFGRLDLENVAVTFRQEDGCARDIIRCDDGQAIGFVIIYGMDGVTEQPLEEIG
ncbi:MAG: hypothetical protein WAZ14_04090 [Patescibacteria group bacterium]